MWYKQTNKLGLSSNLIMNSLQPCWIERLVAREALINAAWNENMGKEWKLKNPWGQKMLSQICSTRSKKDMVKSKNKTKDMPVTWHEKRAGNKKLPVKKSNDQEVNIKDQHQKSTSQRPLRGSLERSFLTSVMSLNRHHCIQSCS